MRQFDIFRRKLTPKCEYTLLRFLEQVVHKKNNNKRNKLNLVVFLFILLLVNKYIQCTCINVCILQSENLHMKTSIKNIQNLSNLTSENTKLCDGMANRTSCHVCVCVCFIDIACSTITIIWLYYAFFLALLCYMNAVLVIHIFIETFFFVEKVCRRICSKTFTIYTQLVSQPACERTLVSFTFKRLPNKVCRQSWFILKQKKNMSR